MLGEQQRPESLAAKSLLRKREAGEVCEGDHQVDGLDDRRLDMTACPAHPPERQRDRETERQADRQTARQTDRHTHRHTDRQRDRETETALTPPSFG